MKNDFTFRFLCLLSTAFLISSCTRDSETKREAKNWQSHNAKLNSIETELKDLASKIKNAHGSGKCKMDSDCKIIGLGHQSCGGFRDWLLYSTLDTEETEVIGLVKNFNKKSDELNDLSLKVPPCGTQPASVRCIREHCTPTQ